MSFTLRLWPRPTRFVTPVGIKQAISEQSFSRARRGSAAVEFAIVGPVLLLVLTGIFAYGSYFLTAHTVQQITNDAARAAIGGLDDEERRMLAQRSVDASLEAQPYMHGELQGLTLTRVDQAMVIEVTYDASDDLYAMFRPIAPLPSPHITRTASVRVGGY